MEDDRVRHEGGEYKEVTTPDSALEAVRHADIPFVTAGDVADELDCSRTTARRKLADLDDRGNGTLRRREVGSSATVWWLPDNDNKTDDG